MDLNTLQVGQRFAVRARVSTDGVDLETRGLFFVLDFKRKRTKGRDVSLIGLVSCNGAGSIIVDAGKLRPEGPGFILPGGPSGRPALTLTPAEGTGAGTGLTLGPLPPEPLCPELDGPFKVLGDEEG